MNQTNKKQSGHVRFYILLAMLLGLAFVRYSLQIGIPRELLMVMAVLIAMTGSRDEIIAVCLCCIPLHESLNLYYTLILCILVYAVKFPQDLRINPTIIPILLLVVWELLHCFGEDFSIVGFICDCTPLLVLAIFMCGGKKQFDYEFLARTLAITTAALCIVLLGRIIYQVGFDLVAAFSGIQRLGLTSEEGSRNAASANVTVGSEMNPNTLGILCVLAATGLLQLRTAGCGRRSDTLLMIGLLIFGTLTSSRTYIVCLALMAVLMLFSQKGSLSEKLRFLGIIVLVLALALLVLYLVFPELLLYYYSRFQTENLTTGRMGLMGIYHRFILSDPEITFFGIGLHDLTDKVLNVYRVAQKVPHNGLQELVIAWGLPGLVMFLLLWIMMIWRSRQLCRKQTLLNYIPLLILLAKIQAGQMLNSAYTMLAFSYAYLSMAHDFRLGNPEETG